MAFSSENGQAQADRKRLESELAKTENAPHCGAGWERLDRRGGIHNSRRPPPRMPGTLGLAPLAALLGRLRQVGQRPGIAVRMHGLVQRLVPPLATTALQQITADVVHRLPSGE